MSYRRSQIRNAVRGSLSRLRAKAANPAGTAAEEFYSSQPTCQIPNLDYLFRKYLGEREVGYYVEVGANDGLFASNTYGLALRGWSGLLVEPLPDLASECRHNYSRFGNVSVVESAVGSSTGSVTLEVFGAVTSASPNVLNEYKRVGLVPGSGTPARISVPCRTLDEILEEHEVPRDFDVLVVDVEGFESEVFLGFSIRQYMPKMVIVELIDAHPYLTATESHDALLGKKIVEQGYVTAYKDMINTVLVRKDVWQRAFGLDEELGDSR